MTAMTTTTTPRAPYQPGDTVKVLYNAGAKGTCLAPTVVKFCTPRAGRGYFLTVTAPDDAVTATPDGTLTYTVTDSGHDDYVMRYDPAVERRRRAMDLGYHIGLTVRNDRPAAAPTYMATWADLLTTAPSDEHTTLTADFLAELIRVGGAK